MGACSSNCSEWNVDEKWSSQEWKSDELMEARTGRPVCEQPPGLFTEHTDKFIVDDNDVDSDTEAESDMPLLSRSLLHKVNLSSAKDSRPIIKRCNTRQQQEFFNLVNVYVFDIGSICIHGKELLRKFAFRQKYRKRSHFETDVRHI